MPWRPDYATLAEAKAYLRITDTADDAEIAVAITAASRAIDKHCARQFGVEAAAVARLYTWTGERIYGRQSLPVDDVSSTTGLAVVTLDEDGTTADTLTSGTDYDLWPYNATHDDRPWSHLVLRPSSVAFLPRTARGVQVTALFGWAAVPAVVEQATLVQASRFFVRRHSPYGIAGSPETGSEMRLLARVDPDVALALGSVRRTLVAS